MRSLYRRALEDVIMQVRLLRRGLVTLNVFLALGTLAIAYSFFMQVRPASARILERAPSELPSELVALEKRYLAQRREGLVWEPQAPVSRRKLERNILREEHARNDPPHWIFCGPTMTRGRRVTLPPITTGAATLESLGRILAVYYDPARESLIIFDFADTTRNLVLGVGDPLSPTRDAGARFELADVVRTGARTFDVVFAERRAPHERFTLPFGSNVFSHPRWYSEPVGQSADLAAKTQPGGAGESPRSTSAAPTRSLIRPTISPHRGRARTFDVRFDEAGWRALKRMSAKELATTIKTAAVTDPKTGRRIGLRVTGLTPDSSLRAFDVKPGDILISLNGQPVPDRSTAIRILDSVGPDALVTVVLERRGVELTYLVDASDPHTRRKARGLELR